MLMLSGEKQTEWGRIQLKSMMSLEPLMSNFGYPNLFATGGTTGGEPLVDRQHPHDLCIELAARIDVNVDDDARLFVYGGPVGEPAIGPSAFMHRGSARYNPEAPITGSIRRTSPMVWRRWAMRRALSSSRDHSSPAASPTRNAGKLKARVSTAGRCAPSGPLPRPGVAGQPCAAERTRGAASGRE